MKSTDKIYAVLFQYSPNGRNDKGEFSAEIANNEYFLTKDDACAFIKAKYDDILEQEQAKGNELDPEWAEKLTDSDMAAMGYSFEKDFSRLSFEYESRYSDTLSEPKYSWTVIELTNRSL